MFRKRDWLTEHLTQSTTHDSQAMHHIKMLGRRRSETQETTFAQTELLTSGNNTLTISITCQTAAMNNTTFGRNQKSTTWSTIRLMLKYSLYDDSRETKYIQLPKA